MKFIADSMLGKLAKWLRVLGHDTLYQSYYPEGSINKLLEDGRILISRHKKEAENCPNSLLVHSNHVKEQLTEMSLTFDLQSDGSRWFTRCLRCNALLLNVTPEEAKENVPEYIFFQTRIGIKFCPQCARYYWPGSHREKMIAQLEEWGFNLDLRIIPR